MIILLLFRLKKYPTYARLLTSPLILQLDSIVPCPRCDASDPAYLSGSCTADRVKPKAFRRLTSVSELQALIVGSVHRFVEGPSMFGRGVGMCCLSRSSLS